MGVVFFIGIVEEVNGEISKIKIYEEYKDGLEGIENYKKILILYWFHKRDDYRNRQTLKVHPKGDKTSPMRGVFATRSPSRPNPIGVTPVELVGIEGNILYVKGLDAYPGSPIVDIKPIKRKEKF
ncbi:MAG: tRNA (N6-threonylcarbamoyladenosine(37)-N6)-methyltransferase TrmO [Candidatus Njordarchaeia archaeon]